jgi:hypothetical protein
MLQIGISRIPDRHIMNRWTRVARDILPDEMNFYQSESLPAPALTYRHRLLSASAERIVTEGDHDAETFEIATKHMNRAFMEIADYMKMKAMGETDGFHSNDERSCGEHGTSTDTDGEIFGNSYGAAGCSARVSDSELLRMRPPEAKRVNNRPRIIRYKSRLDLIQNKLKKKRVTNGSKKKKSKTRCTTCGLEDHKASECHTKTVDMSIPVVENW